MSNELLVEELVSLGVISTDSVRDAFLAVDRADFVLEEFLDEAYSNRPLPIGHDQTISQPLTVALMLEDLVVKEGMCVLDVGCGCGYSTALLNHLVGFQGVVFGVERVPALVEFAKKNLRRVGVEVDVLQATDTLGLVSKAPFDRILVSAAAKQVPKQLVSQLVVGGLMVVPVNNDLLTVKRVKEGYEVVRRREGFRFVKLVE